jgi:hypothetical protein
MEQCQNGGAMAEFSPAFVQNAITVAVDHADSTGMASKNGAQRGRGRARVSREGSLPPPESRRGARVVGDSAATEIDGGGCAPSFGGGTAGAEGLGERMGIGRQRRWKTDGDEADGCASSDPSVTKTPRGYAFPPSFFLFFYSCSER